MRLAAGGRAGFESPQAFGGLLERRIELDRLAEVGDGAGGIREPLADQAARGKSACRTTIEGDGAVGVCQGFGGVAGQIARPGAIVEGERGLRR